MLCLILMFIFGLKRFFGSKPLYTFVHFLIFMRQARLSGIYYKAAPTLLNQQLEEAFLSSKGPGALPANVKGKKSLVKGLIVPRYSYDKAGPAMAWSYKALAESGVPDVIIIIGQSEKGTGLSTEPYETPYGILRVDQKLALAISEKGNIKENNPLFDEDEFIESQLPFLQYVFSKKESLKILPMLISPDTELKKIVLDIKEALMEQNKKATIIVPTNFTSYGRNYNYIPFSSNAHKQVYELDEGAIKLVQDNKPNDFLKYVDEKAMNTDNFMGVVALLLLLKPKKALLEQYYTTADLDQDYKNFVSFASLVFK